MELIGIDELEKRIARAGKPSKRAIAKAAGWKSHTYIQRLLNGEAKTVKVISAVRIAYFLGCGVDDLFVPRSSSEARELANLQAANPRPQKTRRTPARRNVRENAA